jgi:hypothetical protein
LHDWFWNSPEALDTMVRSGFGSQSFAHAIDCPARFKVSNPVHP